jgi:hypothetical protein
MLNIYKVTTEFGSYPDTELDAFAGRVLSGLTKNAAFPNPPVSIADLGKLVDGFHSSLQASLEGGIQLTSAKNNARDELDRALRQEACYVESIASFDHEKLLSSGFYAVTGTRRSSSPLIKPIVALVQDRGTTRMRVKLARVTNAKSYQVQYSANGNGGWQDGGVFTNTRGIVLEQLAPGTVYNVRVRAFGGSTGTSDWSDPISKMAV